MTASRVLFLTSNGVGLGHLTRSLAIGRRLPPDVDMVIFTLSQAAPLVARLGVPVEFMVSRGHAQMVNREWNDLYRHRILGLLDEYDPAVVSFDGTFPYRGLLNAAATRPDLPWVWSRRAMWRAGRGLDALERAVAFNAVLEPGEFAATADPGATVDHRDQVRRVPPITLTERTELRSREDACAELGISPTGTNVLVQLGAGNIDDIASTAGIVVARLLEGSATVVVPISPIAETRPELPAGCHVVSAYPLAPLFRAFDAAVAAAGYNSFHELLDLAVPTLLVPNRETAMDDQVARATWAADAGVALACEPDDPVGIRSALDRLLDPVVREGLAEACGGLDDATGADEAATFLAGLVPGGRR